MDIGTGGSSQINALRLRKGVEDRAVTSECHIRHFRQMQIVVPWFSESGGLLSCLRIPH